MTGEWDDHAELLKALEDIQKRTMDQYIQDRVLDAIFWARRLRDQRPINNHENAA